MKNHLRRRDAISTGPILGNRSLFVLLMAGLFLILTAVWLYQVSRTSAGSTNRSGEASMESGLDGIRALTAEEIEDARHLIAASRSRRGPDGPVVLDSGKTPSGSRIRSLDRPALPTLLMLHERVEQYLQSETQSMLDAMLGSGHAVVRIHAELGLERGEDIGSPPDFDDRAHYLHVQRLSVSVAVDSSYRTSVYAAGDAEGARQRPPSIELGQIGALVRSAVGFDSIRGDRMELVSMAFAAPSRSDAVSSPFKGVIGQTALSLTLIAACVLVGLTAVFVLVRASVVGPGTLSGVAAESTQESGAHRAGEPAYSEPRPVHPSEAFLTHARLQPAEAAKVIRSMMIE